MELRHLRYFVAVAEELHFGKAALRLNVAQPPLSQQILKLEDEIGVRLLHRTTRHVELTEAGSVFLEHARRILQAADQAAAAARRTARGEVGRLRIGFVDSAVHGYLPRFLTRYRSNHPNVDIDLVPVDTMNQFASLISDRVQVAFVRPPVPARTNLSFKVVGRDELAAIFPVGHPLTRRRYVRMADLIDENLVLFERQAAPAAFDEITARLSEFRITPVIREEANELRAITTYVEAGLGVAFGPASLTINSGSNVVCKPVRPRLLLELLLAWRGWERSPLVDSFVETVLEMTRSAKQSSK